MSEKGTTPEELREYYEDERVDRLHAKLDKIIELQELQVAIAVAQDEDEPEEVDRGYLDG